MPTRDRSGKVLRRRALNRATLERQLLLHRWALPPEEAIERLVGLQAQTTRSWYIALWARLDGFDPNATGDLLTTRRTVRIALMRSTIHLVTARDALALRPLVQPVIDRGMLGAYGRPLDGLDIADVAAAGRTLVDERALTFADLGARLAERWPDRDPLALAQAVRTRVPLVQVPPRGVWGASGQARHTSAESWLGRPLEPEPDIEDMMLRYLAAFGPATVRDVQTWSGLTRLGEVVERLRSRLATFRDESGRELFDLPAAPRPDPDTPAPPRFLPDFDNLTLSHADRTRVVADADRKRMMTRNAVQPGVFLVDGFVNGAWTVDRSRDAATLNVRPFGRLAKADAAAVTGEGTRLLALVAADADRHDVRLIPPT